MNKDPFNLDHKSSSTQPLLDRVHLKKPDSCQLLVITFQAAMQVRAVPDINTLNNS
jgi:hypothetical protein